MITFNSRSRLAAEAAQTGVTYIDQLIAKIESSNSLSDFTEKKYTKPVQSFYVITIKIVGDANTSFACFIGVIDKDTFDTVFLEAVITEEYRIPELIANIETNVTKLCAKKGINPYIWTPQEKEVAEYAPNDPNLITISDYYIYAEFDALKQFIVSELTDYATFVSSHASSVAPSASAGSISVDDAISHMYSTGGVMRVQSEVSADVKEGYVVEIVHDYSNGNNGKLRARTNDGANGKAWVQFPNNAREAGAVYVLPKHEVKFTDRGFYSVSSRLDCSPYRVR